MAPIKRAFLAHPKFLTFLDNPGSLHHAIPNGALRGPEMLNYCLGCAIKTHFISAIRVVRGSHLTIFKSGLFPRMRKPGHKKG